MTIPVEYVNRPANLTFKNLPATVEVDVTGEAAGEVGPLTIDLARSRAGENYYLVTPRQVRTPPSVQVKAIRPSMLVLTADVTKAPRMGARQPPAP